MLCMSVPATHCEAWQGLVGHTDFVPIDPSRWGLYNAAQANRPVRPLARAALEVAGDGHGRVAVELGCGAGIEARFLAENGWRVHTFDADPTVAPQLAALRQELPIHHTQGPLEQLTVLPRCHLVLACASLTFVPADHFPRLWQAICDALNPGAVVAVDLFGDKDDWAEGVGTFPDRAEVEGMLKGLDIVSVVEEERDGQAFSGPKHWHTFQVLARARTQN